VDFPGAAQVLQVRRTRTIKGRKHVEVAYLVCSLPMEQAQPEQVAAWVQGHWGIENRLHWVRDVVFDEDRHQLRTRNGPEIMTTLRNLTTRTHPPGPRRSSRYRLHHQIPVTTTKTRHQAHRPANHLTRTLPIPLLTHRPCRPPATQPPPFQRKPHPETPTNPKLCNSGEVRTPTPNPHNNQHPGNPTTPK